ncbi:MAG: TonB dependent receptor, partial [Candidatus Angelobacter sp.]|nr:TonB dependent receptor [Candidatus Angelobacter sp.]
MRYAARAALACVFACAFAVALALAAGAAALAQATATAVLVVTVIADPGTTATGALVTVSGQTTPAATVRLGSDSSATVTLPPAGTYTVVVTKPGFVPAESRIVVARQSVAVRLALHAVAGSALRTIGSASTAQRGAVNRGPAPLVVVPREAYRDMSQPGLDDVLTQKPAVVIDRAGRGIGAADAPPVPLVRGGAPLETQVLIEGDPVALATTRTIPLGAIPSFVTAELEIQPGASAALPTIDGAINGTLNVRFAEPTPVWRALPEQGFDGRGGSFTDIAGGGASADRRVAFAVAGTVNGATGDVAATDAVQRALLVKARAALSSRDGLTVTSFSEGDADRLGANRFAFDGVEYRHDGERSALLVRGWHVASHRDGSAAGDPLETRTDDALTGASLELDRTAGSTLLSLGATETYGTGSASGAVDLTPGSRARVETLFARAILRPAPRWQVQLAAYGVRSDAVAGERRVIESGPAGRIGVAYRASDRLTVRASSGTGFAPPPLVALAGLRGPLSPETATTTDLGFDARLIDAATALSADVFTTTGGNRLVEVGGALPWIDAGAFSRHGAEISLTRFVPVGFGYLLQAWTASDGPAFARSAGDVAGA